MAPARINVLFIFVQIDIMGGSERLVYNLVERLDRTRFNPSVAWFYGDKKRPDFERLGVPLHHVPKLRRFDPATMRRMASIIAANDIRVVNAHHFLSMVYAWYGCRMNRAGLIYTEHSAWELDRIPLPWRAAGRCLLRQGRAVGVSGAVAGRLREVFRLSADRVTALPNGVDLQAFRGTGDRAGRRRQLGLAETDVVIGVTANFKRVKNHLFLLRAFGALAREVPALRLMLIGQGSSDDPENTEPELRRFAERHGLGPRILFLGYRTDVPDLLPLMDIFCLTSREEGLPVSAIEAMAAGLPVVGTDVPGIREVVAPRRNGFLVPTDDDEALRDAIGRLVRDDALRKAFGKESRAIAAADYSLSACTARYQELFASALEQAVVHAHGASRGEAL